MGAGAQRNSDAGGSEHFVSADQEGSGGQYFLNSGGDADGVAGVVNVFDHDGKFVSAEPGYGVVGGGGICGVARVSGKGVVLAQRTCQALRDSE